MAGKHANVFVATDVLRMFPTFVWKAELEPGVCRGLNESIILRLEQIRRSDAKTAPDQSWQSGHNLFQREEFHELANYVHEAVRHVLDFLKIGEVEFQISGCWANMNPPNAAHGRHNHPNNFLSGVYYVQTYRGSDTINFHDPRSQTDIIKPPVSELIAETTDQVVVKVKSGTVLIFPSWLTHSVDAKKSDQIRISIRFNVMFSAYAETMSEPLW